MNKKNDHIVSVKPGPPFKGEVTVPGDKSVSHRAVMLGAIADGVTRIEGLLEGEDNISTICAFRQMGVEIDGPSGGVLTVHGVGLDGLKAPAGEPMGEIDCGNSGTTARLLSGILAAQSFRATLTGDASLRKRPMKRIVEPLRVMGARIEGADGGDHLPLTITGSSLKGISYKNPIASAQVKSCILLAGLYAGGETTVEEPGKSRDHTERMLRGFGAEVEVDGKRVTVKKSKGLKATEISVPGDISSAAFFIVAAAVTPGSELIIRKVGVNPTRTGVIAILMKMGAEIEILTEREEAGEPVADIKVTYAPLKGVEVHGEELLPAIDEFPAICVAAAFAEGETVITGAAELRLKESDRIAVMARSLEAIGVECEEYPGGLTVVGKGGGVGGVEGGDLESFGDHRIAMAMAVAGAGSNKGVSISGASCVDVSFPGFFELLEDARGGAEG